MFEKIFDRLFGSSHKEWHNRDTSVPTRHPFDESDEELVQRFFGQHGVSPPQFFFFRQPFGSSQPWTGPRGTPDQREGPDDQPHQDNEDPFQRGFGGIASDPQDMFRHFEEMFRGFDDLFRGMGIAEFPRMLPPGGTPTDPGLDPHNKDSGSLRDKMLKQPDSDTGHYSSDGGSLPRRGTSPRNESGSMLDRLWITPKWDQRTHEKLDQDLDAAAKQGKLEHILGPLQSFHPEHDRAQPYPTDPAGKQRQAFNRVSVRTFRSTDGKVEERRSVTDDRGVREDTVTRTLDGQTYTRVTCTDPSGTSTVKEKFNNMDEAEKGEFERKWRGQVGNGPLQLDSRHEHHLHDKMASTQQETSGAMKNLFRFNFPGFNFSRKTDADR